MELCVVYYGFFFQAEDGIRDGHVTGVQTCALPISRAGLEGMAISFYTENDTPLIQQLEKKGITFVYSEIKDGEWVEAKRYNKRQLRKNTSTQLDQEAWKYVKKPKKVKPGYKKKMKKQQQKVKRRLQKNTNRKHKK